MAPNQLSSRRGEGLKGFFCTLMSFCAFYLALHSARAASKLDDTCGWYLEQNDVIAIRDQIFQKLEITFYVLPELISMGNFPKDPTNSHTSRELLDPSYFSSQAQLILMAQARFLSRLEQFGYLKKSADLSPELAFNLFHLFGHSRETVEPGMGPHLIFEEEQRLLEEWQGLVDMFRISVGPFIQQSSFEQTDDPLAAEVERWIDETQLLIERFEDFFVLDKNPSMELVNGSPDEAIQRRRAAWDVFSLDQFSVQSPSK